VESAPLIIRGAREHNLKNISLEIPTQKFIVITGPSGSGKSSLAFDTIFSEGQRRYMESLSAYARQFLDQLSKPDVDFIDGLSPSIAIEQKTISSHPRSTVGTVTGVYDFLRLLYARFGEVRDPETGETLKAHSNDDILNFFQKFPEGEKIQCFASVVRGRKGEFLREFEQWRRMGFTKVLIDGSMKDLHDPILLSRYQNHDVDLLVDTIITGKPDLELRLKEVFKNVDKYAEGWLRCRELKKNIDTVFSRKLASSAGTKTFPELEPRLFSFNSPYGMCLKCKGLGYIERDKPKAKKVTEKQSEDDNDTWYDEEEDHLELCPSCKGARLRQESLWVYFAGKNIYELSQQSALDLEKILNTLKERKELNVVSQRIVEEIVSRLKFLENVGVGYLSLDRRTSTISGGEAQRIRLATQLGSQLSGVLYVLDEPSIGLHPRDNKKLIQSLHNLRDLGNTVLVVEHDEETMLASDFLIDIGPGAGRHGGHLVAHGYPKDFLKNKESTTAQYLNGALHVTEDRSPRKGSGQFIEITGCRGNNLKNVDLKVPLGKLIVFTGVSGSGKSSLVRDTLETAIVQKFYRAQKSPLPFDKISGLQHIDKILHVNQKPIGRLPRSNPSTYTGLFGLLRTLFAQTPDAQMRGYTPGTFSFNVKGGRCDACEGAGRKKIEMHFLADVFVECEICRGSRYRQEVLEVRFKGKNISDCLNMSVEEAYEHFKNQPLIEAKLKTLIDVGLGYIHLGQASHTLSGGEAQRIKLAKELSKRSTGKTLYVLDEPTTGLHFNDVKKLLEVLQLLSDQGNTILVIEHNLDVVAAADWVIDIGPEAGQEGGQIIFEGAPMNFLNKKITISPTSTSMKEYYSRKGIHQA
jgi:excinuclease ABC subunit A